MEAVFVDRRVPAGGLFYVVQQGWVQGRGRGSRRGEEFFVRNNFFLEDFAGEQLSREYER